MTEIRNQINEHGLHSTTSPAYLPTGLALSSTCRKIREEYMPLLFENVEIYADLYKLKRFLEMFFIPTTAAATYRPICNLRARVLARDEPIVDILWLVECLRQHPGVKISFWSVYAFEGPDMSKLLEAARSTLPSGKRVITTSSPSSSTCAARLRFMMELLDHVGIRT
jgi:hypothetical protein